MSKQARSKLDPTTFELRAIRSGECLLADTWDDGPGRISSSELLRFYRKDCGVGIFAYVGPGSPHPLGYCVARCGEELGRLNSTTGGKASLPTSTQISRIVVKPLLRRQGIGSQMVRDLAESFTALYPIPVVADVPEDRDDWVGMFRKAGGKASLVRGLFENRDGYRFRID